MQKGSTTFLKGVIYLLALASIALCILALPVTLNPKYAMSYHPLLFGMYASAIPFFIILYKGLTLLKLIDKNMAFSEASTSALKQIKRCATLISVLYALDLPFIYVVADKADAPGLMLLGLVLVCGPFVVAVFAAVLEKLLQNGMEIKSENDLTV